VATRQRGRLEKLPSGRWSARWYDQDGVRQRQGGFETKSEAGEWLDRKVEEVRALRLGDIGAVRRQTMPTLTHLVDEYLEQHSAERNTLRILKARLRYATDTFGDTRIDRLDPQAIGAWRKRLPERSAWAIHKTLRQVLHYAVRVKLLDENPASVVPNPEPKRREVPTFESVADLDLVAAELHPRFAAIPVFAGLTGLRPEEWIALERRDIDTRNGIVHVRRVFTDGELKPYGKQSRSLRAVPLPMRASEALAALTPRVDTTLLFPGQKGAHLNLHNWRADHWTPAVRAAGLAHRPPYALRHAFAAFSIAAGVSLSNWPASWAPASTR
jgi:integrase